MSNTTVHMVGQTGGRAGKIIAAGTVQGGITIIQSRSRTQQISVGMDVQKKDDMMQLSEAAERGSPQKCEGMLLETGADVKVQDKDGNTPLHRPAQGESEECVDILLKAGGSVHVQN